MVEYKKKFMLPQTDCNISRVSHKDSRHKILSCILIPVYQKIKSEPFRFIEEISNFQRIE